MIPLFLLRKWVPQILLVLGSADPSMRFNELMRAIPQITDRMLTERLNDLEREGLVVRAVAAGPPVRVWYRLTPAAERYLEPLRALEAVG